VKIQNATRHNKIKGRGERGETLTDGAENCAAAAGPLPTTSGDCLPSTLSCLEEHRLDSVRSRGFLKIAHNFNSAMFQLSQNCLRYREADADRPSVSKLLPLALALLSPFRAPSNWSSNSALRNLSLNRSPVLPLIPSLLLHSKLSVVIAAITAAVPSIFSCWLAAPKVRGQM